MRSSKPRSRSKNNRNRNNNSLGNVVNRVFDSSGPEGKVRGTPQQIIDKYNQLARDATLSNDRVAAENFQQHAEHYLRLLSEAQREQDTRREQQERENREKQAQRDRERAERDAQRGGGHQRSGHHSGPNTPAHVPAEQPVERTHQPHVVAVVDPGAADQPDVFEMPVSGDADSGLVETPESRSPQVASVAAEPKVDASAQPELSLGGEEANASAGGAAPAEKKPAAKRTPKPRSPRKPAAKKADAEASDAEKKPSKPKATRTRKPKAAPAAESSTPDAASKAGPTAAETTPDAAE